MLLAQQPAILVSLSDFQQSNSDFQLVIFSKGKNFGSILQCPRILIFLAKTARKCKFEKLSQFR